MGRAATTTEIERSTNYLTEYAAAAREVLVPRVAQAARRPAKRSTTQFDIWEYKLQLQKDGGKVGPGGSLLTASKF